MSQLPKRRANEWIVQHSYFLGLFKSIANHMEAVKTLMFQTLTELQQYQVIAGLEKAIYS